MTNTTRLDPRLYLVGGEPDTLDRDLADVVELAARGGATLFQLREKQQSTGRFIQIAKAVKTRLARYDVPLLINDRVDVALAAGAAGVHIGQADMAPEDARRLLGPNAIIGLTVRDAEEVNNAPVSVLDYLSIGGVFSTSSKTNTRAPIGLEGLSNLVKLARAKSDLPITAIAGINASNLAATLKSGVDGVAIISAITHEKDVMQSTAHIRSLIDQTLSERSNKACQ